MLAIALFVCCIATPLLLGLASFLGLRDLNFVSLWGKSKAVRSFLERVTHVVVR